MCRTFEYPVGHHSTECMDDGVGCDGTCECDLDCNCTCHGRYAPDFVTQEDVREYHK